MSAGLGPVIREEASDDPRKSMSSAALRTVLLLLGAIGVCMTVPALASGVVLYDQTDNATTSNHGSNDWIAPHEGFTDQIADDFIVPSGQSWQISGVDVLGIGGYASPTINIFIYANAGSLPGAELFRQSVVAMNEPDYSVAVSGTPNLNPGTYWISVQQTGTEVGTGWYWKERSVQSGNPAAYRNPAGSSVATCTAWSVRSTCFPSSPPDELFKLSGTASVYPPPATPATPAAPTGERAAALNKCKKNHKKNHNKKRFKKCKKKANLLPA
jgi:hypothetical protein